MLMVLLMHISIAIISIIVASLALARPTKLKLNIGYGLAAATLVSGTYLIVSTGAPIVSSCIAGVTYLTIVGILLALGSRSLAKQTA